MEVAGPSPSDFPRVMFRLELDSPMAENTLQKDTYVPQAVPMVWALNPLWGIPGRFTIAACPQCHDHSQGPTGISEVLRNASCVLGRCGLRDPLSFLSGKGIPVPTCPVITSCSSQSPVLGMLQVGSGQQFLCLHAHHTPKDPGRALPGTPSSRPGLSRGQNGED